MKAPKGILKCKKMIWDWEPGTEGVYGNANNRRPLQRRKRVLLAEPYYLGPRFWYRTKKGKTVPLSKVYP